MLIPNTSPTFLPWKDNDPAPSWSGIFGNDNPLALEIGCGVGDFIVQMAVLHPDLNFVALDFYNKGCIKTCKRVDKAGLSNVRVLRAEARTWSIPALSTICHVLCVRKPNSTSQRTLLTTAWMSPNSWRFNPDSPINSLLIHSVTILKGIRFQNTCDAFSTWGSQFITFITGKHKVTSRGNINE